LGSPQHLDSAGGYAECKPRSNGRNAELWYGKYQCSQLWNRQHLGSTGSSAAFRLSRRRSIALDDHSAAGNQQHIGYGGTWKLPRFFGFAFDNARLGNYARSDRSIWYSQWSQQSSRNVELPHCTNSRNAPAHGNPGSQPDDSTGNVDSQ
jgi:hypothetical protein